LRALARFGEPGTLFKNKTTMSAECRFNDQNLFPWTQADPKMLKVFQDFFFTLMDQLGKLATTVRTTFEQL
jgi:hypothetical protein